MKTTRSTTKGRLTLLAIGLLVAMALATYSGLVSEATKPPTTPTAPEPDETTTPWLRRNIDLAAQVKKYTSAHGGATDLSAQFYGNAEFSAHLHLMGPEQFCPLHHHPDGYELSAIVAGQGYLRGDLPDGLQERLLSPGDVVVSSRGSRHEIGNRSTTDYLAALVIATPSFQGNLYVHEDRTDGAGQSTLLSATGVLRPARQVPFAPWSEVISMSIEEPTSLAGGGTLLLYVREGNGILAEVDGANAPPLAAPQLLVVRDAPKLVVTPSQEAALHLVTIRFLSAGERLP